MKIRKLLIPLLASMFVFIPSASFHQLEKPFPTVEAASTQQNATQKDHHKPIHRATPITTVHSAHPTIPLLELGNIGPQAEWLNEALSELHYEPLTIDTKPTSSTTIRNDLAQSIKTGTLQPIPANWSWRFKVPTSLSSLWRKNKVTKITQGAIMTFEAAHGLAVDGIAGPEVDAALYSALTTDQATHQPYTYVTVTQSLPEHLDLWENQHVVLSSLANTGIAASPTPNGTWPIYLRYLSQEMKGREPNGTTYDDKGVPYVNYFYGGCAIHGFVRASYGSPQSLGCVELPPTVAAKVYNALSYGTLVTIKP